MRNGQNSYWLFSVNDVLIVLTALWPLIFNLVFVIYKVMSYLSMFRIWLPVTNLQFTVCSYGNWFVGVMSLRAGKINDLLIDLIAE